MHCFIIAIDIWNTSDDRYKMLLILNTVTKSKAQIN